MTPEEINHSRKTTATEAWLRENGLTDGDVCSLAQDIMTRPVLWSATQKLYSEAQMCEMFRLGVLRMAEGGFRRIKGGRRWKPFAQMRLMEAGDALVFPYEAWMAARSAATKLKHDYGAIFTVTKLASYNKIGDIEVKRIK